MKHIHHNSGVLILLISASYLTHKLHLRQLGYITRKHEDEKAYFDSKWTLEAICNILDNALKYTNEGTISLSVTAYEMFVRIDIKDSGIGIKEEELPKIFSRFYRSEDTKNMEGVGIGLYLSRQILSEEGGYIKVSSVYGQGSTFSVFLPKSA